MNEILARKLKELPDSPGCYIMKHQGEVIYVGKAVNLKNRVRQYFHESAKHEKFLLCTFRLIYDISLIQRRNERCMALQYHETAFGAR